MSGGVAAVLPDDDDVEQARLGRTSHSAAPKLRPAQPLPIITPAASSSAALPHNAAAAVRRRRPPPPYEGAVRAAAARFFNSRAYHLSVVALVLLDLALVVTDLSFSLVYSCHAEEPEGARVAGEVFAIGSITILSTFVVEFLLRLWSLGPGHFRHPAHVLDVGVVVASLVLEVVLRHRAMAEVAALLVVFRLWRLVRVLHAAGEVAEWAHEERHTALIAELDLTRAQVNELRGLLRHGGGGEPAGSNQL